MHDHFPLRASFYFLLIVQWAHFSFRLHDSIVLSFFIPSFIAVMSYNRQSLLQHIFTTRRILDRQRRQHQRISRRSLALMIDTPF